MCTAAGVCSSGPMHKHPGWSGKEPPGFLTLDTIINPPPPGAFGITLKTSLPGNDSVRNLLVLAKKLMTRVKNVSRVQKSRIVV